MNRETGGRFQIHKLNRSTSNALWTWGKRQKSRARRQINCTVACAVGIIRLLFRYVLFTVLLPTKPNLTNMNIITTINFSAAAFEPRHVVDSQRLTSLNFALHVRQYHTIIESQRNMQNCIWPKQITLILGIKILIIISTFAPQNHESR